MSTDRQVAHTASLAPATVTKVAQAPKFETFPRQRQRARARTKGWVSPVIAEQIPDDLLYSAIKAAGGDTNRLWFGEDGAVWILNHTRETKCPSPACPACTASFDW